MAPDESVSEEDIHTPVDIQSQDATVNGSDLEVSVDDPVQLNANDMHETTQDQVESIATLLNLCYSYS